MGTLTALRRAPAGAPPPMSEARQKLADAIAADTAAKDRLALLAEAQGRARAAWAAADEALGKARQAAQEAAAQAYQRNVAELMGQPPPAIPTRAEATAALQAATDTAADAEAAARAIAAEIDALQAEQHRRTAAIDEAAQGVLAEEMADSAEKLVNEINSLRAALIDKGRALRWLWQHNAIKLHGDAASPGANAATEALAFPVDQSRLWHTPGASPTEARMQATLDALRHDATAEIPK